MLFEIIFVYLPVDNPIFLKTNINFSREINLLFGSLTVMRITSSGNIITVDSWSITTRSSKLVNYTYRRSLAKEEPFFLLVESLICLHLVNYLSCKSFGISNIHCWNLECEKCNQAVYQRR